jgi:hypothetical protein
VSRRRSSGVPVWPAVSIALREARQMLVQEVEQQRLLAVVIVVDQRLGDPAGRCDRRHGGAVIALRGEMRRCAPAECVALFRGRGRGPSASALPFRPVVDDAHRLALAARDAARAMGGDLDGLTPTRSLMRRFSASPAAVSASEPMGPSAASTCTVIASIRPSRVSSIWKCGPRPSVAISCSSIWVGKTLTPRRMIMSSERPVTFSIRRMDRAVPGSRRVRSRVR